MSQFGMQMPGGQLQRGPTMNVYTGLLALAVVGLIAACGYMYVQGSKVSPTGQPWDLQKVNESTKQPEIEFPRG
ncbi:MAG: hypothetical protein ACK4WH_00215 [Phycisphaerales bacterium]